MRDGLFLPKRLALQVETDLTFLRIDYPALCQRAIDDQRYLDQQVVDNATGQIDNLARKLHEERQRMPWWQWTLIGFVAGSGAALITAVAR